MIGQADIGFTWNSLNNIVAAPFVLQQGIPQKLAPGPGGQVQQKIPQTYVTLATGNEERLENGGGTLPYVTIWDEAGNRIGKYLPSDEKFKVEQNSQRTMIINHHDNNRREADTGYIMLSQGKDAICIAMLQVSNGQFTAAFYGDTGANCGMSWYHSRRKFGAEILSSKCVWIDEDHSNGINARAMSFHVKDMLPSNDKMRLYEKDNNKYICRSTPRFAFWKNLEPGSDIPIFNPPLQYHEDSKAIGYEGADKDPDRALDKDGEYDRNVATYTRPKWTREAAEAFQGRTYRRNNNRPDVARLSKRQNSNINPDHIVVTEIDGQTAREICEHPNSIGYDIASYVDMKYCDLSERKLYDFCNATITHNCWDANSTTLVGAINARGEESGPRKSYKTKSHWK
ncbi:hypothetical protein CSOJ01_15969 [Colletotrichum sojae]|uniref:Uncharacterized protein n=1 Tax=Colletotrichum sojae TaxID=2175907 RepID=A0A8H6ILP4_9PEZI|nr:hypothetical protein CSOJ01_15969 [Colletotrichum sojae]